MSVLRNRYALVLLGWGVFFLWLTGSGMIARALVFPVINRLADPGPEPPPAIFAVTKPFIFFCSTVVTLFVMYWLLDRIFALISPGERLKDWFVRLNEETIWKK